MAKDFLAMYFIHHGRHIEAIRVYDQIAELEEQLKPLTPAQLRKGRARKLIAQNLRMLLPAAQIPTLAVYESEMAAKAESEGTADEGSEDWVLASGSGSEAAASDHGDMQVEGKDEERRENIKAQDAQATPLSASQLLRVRQPIAAVGTAGQYGPQQTLIKALMRQMITTKPQDDDRTTTDDLIGLPSPHPQSTLAATAGLGLASGTPPRRRMSSVHSTPRKTPRSTLRALAFKSPSAGTAGPAAEDDIETMASPHISARRVPFVGPPVTPNSVSVPFSSFSPAPPSSVRSTGYQDQNAMSPLSNAYLLNAGRTPGRKSLPSLRQHLTPSSVVDDAAGVATNGGVHLPGGFPAGPINRSPFNVEAASTSNTANGGQAARSFQWLYGEQQVTAIAARCTVARRQAQPVLQLAISSIAFLLPATDTKP
ncbi:hypothetical protein EV182_005947 [Spiromyces aspiralis]|uniref:Uncharacterized protein n=1 Tax=Spiromyces aspiralis TaxID=68401 RepID=A0ACC1HM66_9FUNG|nr:hypothetical protein EV182_005947 [Spiromyces aspiralis]